MDSPLVQYGEAVRSFDKGDKEAAADKLAKAFGAESVTAAIASNVDRLVKPAPTLSDGLLRLMAHESRKRGRV